MTLGLLTHELRGRGSEVVLLLNGGMMTHSYWAPVTETLAEHYRLLGCDFRGQLLSPGEGHRRLEDNLPDVVALLDALDLDRVHVLSTSFGGEVGMLLAALYPERVRSLAVVTSADRTPPGMAKSSQEMKEILRQVLDGGDPTLFYDTLVGTVYSSEHLKAEEESFAARRKKTSALPMSFYQGLLGILTSIEDFDLTPHLSAISCPTLVVHAGLDTVMPEDRVRAMHAGIPGAELVVLPESGHALVAEHPRWLGQTYRDFLQRQSASPPAPPSQQGRKVSAGAEK